MSFPAISPAEIAVDYRQAERLQTWRVAAESGQAEAQFRVGDSYLKGRGTAIDLDVARDWLHKSARQGYHKAEFKLGYLYLKGLGVAVDGGQAYHWLKRAADKGYAPAQFYLGEIYALGLAGIGQDRLQAVKWITESVQDGYRPRTEELERIRSVLDKEMQNKVFSGIANR